MRRVTAMLCLATAICLDTMSLLKAELPTPVLQTVFPAGGQTGSNVAVTIEGIGIEGLRELQTTAPGLTAEKIEGNRFRLTIPAATPPGVYDLRIIANRGVSNPRAFMISPRDEQLEGDANDTLESATPVPLNTVVNGKLEKAGDIDCYRFIAKAGQRVVIECWGERIDSQVRGVIEVFNSHGQCLAVSRGHAGLDPVVDFLVPADGLYHVRLFDLTYLGGSFHFYRLDLDNLARPEFCLPCVVTRGQTARVKVFGRNLSPKGPSATSDRETIEVDLVPPAIPTAFIPLPRRPSQLAVDAFAYQHSGGHVPLAIGITDVPVVENTTGHDRPERALELSVPCEVSAQIADVYGQHWYAIHARRGEVLWLEGFGERIGAPVDLEFSVLDPSDHRELARFSDQLENLGGYRFSTAHTDPAGRWIAPIDGRYLVLVRNLMGGADHDPRRIYRLSVRREEPDYQLAMVARRADQPAAWNVARGGRECVEVLALRRRGFAGPIRVTAQGLPAGMDCPVSWIGPGQDRAPLVITASRESGPFAGSVSLIGHAEQDGQRIARRAHGGAMIWPGRPLPSGRVTQEVAVATGIAAPMLLTATPQVTSLDQQSALDVEVALEILDGSVTSPVRLSAIGLPLGVGMERVTMTADQVKGWISFFWPATLPPGPYTFAIQADLDAMIAPNSQAKPVKTSLTVVSNPITVEIKPARILLELDATSPTKIARGKTIQLQFTAERINGFLGKVHTELAAPGGVVGLRARGVTLTGQGNSGSLQVIATENAPLGRHALLRLEAVGTVEDQPIYRASRPVELEIVE